MDNESHVSHEEAKMQRLVYSPGMLALIVLVLGTLSASALPFRQPVNYPVGPSNPRAAAIADFNHDGISDLAVVNTNSTQAVSILLGNGDGTFRAAVNYEAGGASQPIAVGDFNNDGNLDLAIGNLSANVSILFGNGDGSFQPPLTFPVGTCSCVPTERLDPRQPICWALTPLD